MKLNSGLLVIMSLFVLTSHAFAADDISQDKRALIDILLQQTTQTDRDISDLLIDDYLRQINPILKQSQPDISPMKLNKVEHEVTAIVNQEVTEKGRFSEMIYPIYDHYFTSDELEQIIEFNKTELGKKLLLAMPLIALKSREVRDELELDLAPQINQRLVKLLDERQDNQN